MYRSVISPCVHHWPNLLVHLESIRPEAEVVNGDSYRSNFSERKK